MEKCFIICRQSSGQEDPDDSLSITVQIDECKKLAAQRSLEVVDIFKEANTSGRLYPRGFEMIASQDLVYSAWAKEVKKAGQWREGLGDALKRIREVQYIVTYDLTRFFRPLNGSFLGSLLQQILQAHNVKLLTIREGIIDFSRFQDMLVSSLTSQINSEQLRLQTEKSKAAYKRLKDEGAYYAGLMQMHGYRKTGRRLEVEIDPRKAEMVRKVFKLYVDGVAINEIVKRVNETYKDIFTKPCHHSMIHKILSTPAYCGYQRNSEGGLVRSKQLEGKEIVTMDVWMKAHNKLERSKDIPLRPKKRWSPLGGYVVCGHCGAKMKLISRGSDGNSYYVCLKHTRLEGKKPCGNNMFSTADRKEGIGLIDMLKPLLLAEAIRMMKLTRDDSKEREEISRIDLALAEMKRKMKKLTELWMSGTMDEALYESSMRELKQKVSEAEKNKDKLQLDISADASAFEWVKLMMKFRGDYLSRGEYEQLMMGMLKKVVIYKDSIDVMTTFGDVSIPRQRQGRYNLAYEYFLTMEDQKAKVYFHRWGQPSKDVSKFTLVAKLGELEVYVR